MKIATDWLSCRLAPDDLQQRLQERFQVFADPRSPFHSSYCDTFDWTCYQKGFRLLSTPSLETVELELTEPAGHPIDSQEVGSFSGFPADLPEGELRSRLVPLAGLRRLLPILECEGWIGSCCVFEGDGSQKLRLSLESLRFREPDKDWSPLTTRVGIVRCSPDSSCQERLVQAITGLAGLGPCPRDRLDFALEVLGLQPSEYSSKIRVQLEPETRSDEATRKILRSLLETMRANLDGTIRDLDTEFLHDFRVSVRRTRSVLSQVKRVFPRPTVKRFRREFGWLGNITGPTRDLDVYLLNFEDYRSRLPGDLQDELEPLRRFLRREHCREQERMAALLREERCRRLLDDWEKFLGRPVPPSSCLKNARRPIVSVASGRIWRAYRRVQKKGSRITDESPASDLHRLRIECKKLRYLLEFFQSLYSSEELQALIKELKSLQDCLGNLNDYEVQQQALRDFSERMKAEKLGTARTFEAMEQLSVGLREMQADTRRQFDERFKSFSSAENQERFVHLFSEPGDTERVDP